MAAFLAGNRTKRNGRTLVAIGRILIVALSLWAGRDADAAYFVYISFETDNAIGIYQMDPETGTLVLKTTVKVPGGPAPLAWSPDRKVLYVSQRVAKTFSSFTVDQGTGGLTLLNTVPATDNAVFIATDKTGRYLFSAMYAASKMAIHPIGGDGKIGSEPVEDRATGTNPHFIMTNPSNRFLYVPNTGAGKILQFRFDANTGKVQPLAPPEVTTASGAGPRHFVFHGSKNLVYVVNEKNRSLTVYAMDPDLGTLSAQQTVSTVPAAYTGENACADIHLTPDGKFLYASNRGHQSLAGYKVDPATGLLTSVGWTSAPQTPRSFAIDPTGKFLFAAGQSADSLAGYRINPGTGALEPIKVYATGKGPAWVTAMELPMATVSVGPRPYGLSESAGNGFRIVHDLLGRLLQGP